MNTTAQLSSAFQQALATPACGVVGLVDELLRLCPEQGLQLDWQADRCRLRFLGEGSNHTLEQALRKSVFRAVLARVATLCNEHSPNSVSPYGGQGELSLSADPPALFRVAFKNTTAEQKLELMPVSAWHPNNRDGEHGAVPELG